jgi:hypothetical protein
MIGLSRLTRQTFEAPCTVEIEHSPESLHAHVVIEGDVEMQPGDRCWCTTRRPTRPKAIESWFGARRP